MKASRMSNPFELINEKLDFIWANVSEMKQEMLRGNGNFRRNKIKNYPANKQISDDQLKELGDFVQWLNEVKGIELEAFSFLIKEYKKSKGI